MSFAELNARVSPTSRRLLDIGAHAGRFMHLASTEGWVVEGVELNPRTAACAARRTGAPVHHSNAHTLARNGHSCGAVTLTDVLEHIPEPTRLLGTVSQLIEPGGCIAVKVPCGPSQLIKERALAALSSHRISIAENLSAREPLFAALVEARSRTRRVRSGQHSSWRTRIVAAARGPRPSRDVKCASIGRLRGQPPSWRSRHASCFESPGLRYEVLTS